MKLVLFRGGHFINDYWICLDGNFSRIVFLNSVYVYVWRQVNYDIFVSSGYSWHIVNIEKRKIVLRATELLLFESIIFRISKY